MRKEWVFIALFLLILPIVNASFALEEENIIRDYTSGEIVRGTITLDLIKEQANNKITSGFLGNISLIDLIRKNGYVEGQDYQCSSIGCGEEYKITQNSISQISLDEKEYVGFNLTGKEVSIQSASLTLSSNVEASCVKQLVVDVLNKGENKIQSNQYTNSYQCSDSKKYGCFNSNLNSNSYSLLKVGELGLCEKITLGPGPAFEVGARIINTTSGVSAKLNMELYDSNISFLGSCDLPNLQQNVQEISCIINKSIIEANSYYLCIHSDNDQAHYQISGEESGEICGTADLFGTQEEIFDYEIFGKSLPYASIDKMDISDAFESATSEDFAFYLDDYIEQRYGRNCTAGCILPFKFEGIPQTINFSNVSIIYESSFGNVRTHTTISKLSPVQSTMSANDIVLEIQSANFVTSGSGIKKIDFYLGGKKIFNSSLPFTIVPGFNFSVSPKVAFLGLPTSFNIIGANISTAIWDFGDGSQQAISQGKNIQHTYTKSGNYTLQVTATSSSGVTTKRSFVVYAGNAKDSANQLYNLSQKYLNNITAFVSNQPLWLRAGIENKIQIEQKKIGLEEIRKAFNNASSENDYVAIVEEIIDLNVPQSIQQRRTGQALLALGYENIDLDYMESISEASIPIGKEEDVRDSLIYWINQYYSPSVNYNYISKIDQAGNEEILVSSFTIKFNQKQLPTEQVKFFINYPLNEVLFMQEYSQTNIGEGTIRGISIPVGSNDISFAIFDNIELEELGMYLSPPIESLGNFEDEVIEAPKYPTGKVSILIILILAGVFVLYIIIQEWYKRHYEHYLFNNPDDLYNVITFIHNARNVALNDDQSKKKLRESGWSGEQISYAIRKLDGKRTGMYEIPLFKFIERNRVREEIAKRQEKNGKDLLKGRFSG